MSWTETHLELSHWEHTSVVCKTKHKSHSPQVNSSHKNLSCPVLFATLPSEKHVHFSFNINETIGLFAFLQSIFSQYASLCIAPYLPEKEGDEDHK